MDVIDEVPASWLQPQTRSAPELTSSNLKEHNDLHGNCSDNYTSTCTTTTTATTSDEYQRYRQTDAGQSQFYYDQCSVDMNSNYDYEVCSYNKQLGSFSSASTDLMSFSGRRSVQECSESVFNAVNTTQLVNYLKELQTPTEDLHVQSTKIAKKVEFNEHVTEQVLQSTDLSDNSYDLEPISENERATVHLNEPMIELKIKEHKTTIIDITNKGGKPLPPSNIPNAVPKEWTSLMCRALTTASDQPFKITEVPEDSIEDCNVKSCNNECQNTCPNRDICQQQYSAHVETTTSFITCDPCQITQTENNCLANKYDLACAQVQYQDDYSNDCNQESSVTQADTTTCYFDAIGTEQTYKGSYLTSALTVASPNPLQWTKPVIDEDVPLPEESVPYVPPPISKARIQRIQHIGTKSPFLQALTIAPLKSYTPFENDVISQLEDLPTPTQKLNFLDALTIAPEEPVHEFKPELPAETEAEKIARIEKERLDVQAKEVDTIITNAIDLELNKNFSAFAPFKGFRSVHPFKPMPPRDQLESQSFTHNSDNDIQTEIVKDTGAYQSQSNSYESHQHIACSKDSSNRYSNKKTVAFPPPAGTAAKSYVQSGLKSPKTIPKYQRQWFNLPSQSPIKTPEPQELKENVPLAFVEIPQETSDTVSKPLAVTISVTSNEPIDSAKLASSETVSRRSSITSLVSEVKETRQSSAKFTTNLHAVEPVAHRPPTPTHRPSSLPHYQQQQHLVCENYPATTSHVFEPNIRCPSPRARSPAPGPPPNPLKIQAPRLKSPEPLNNSHSNQSNSAVPSIVTGQSGLKLQTIPIVNDSACSQMNSAFQSLKYVAQQNLVQEPETVQHERIGSTNIETRCQENQFNAAKKLDLQSSSTVQIGNTQVQRNRRVVEEYEQSQSSKTIEVYKSFDGDAAALLVNRTSLRASQDDDSEPSDSYSKGFVARQARRLSENTICKSKPSCGNISFPEKASPTPPSLFPVKENRVVSIEPAEQTYHQIKPKINSKLGVAPIPLPGYQQILPNANAIVSPTTNNKKLTQESYPPTKLTKTSVAVLPTAASAVPAIDTILTTSNAYTSNQITTASKSTSVSVPSFKLTNKNQSAVSDPSPASAGPNKGSSFGATSAPKRGRGVLNKSVAPGARVPQCGSCFTQIR